MLHRFLSNIGFANKWSASTSIDARKMKYTTFHFGLKKIKEISKGATKCNP